MGVRFSREDKLYSANGLSKEASLQQTTLTAIRFGTAIVSISDLLIAGWSRNQY
jgi:hypothetical protein